MHNLFPVGLGEMVGLGWPKRCSQKVPKMEPKVIEKVVRRHLVEHAKTMAGTVREAYLEVPGRVQEPLFSGVRCEGIPRGSRGGFGPIFGDFG